MNETTATISAILGELKSLARWYVVLTVMTAFSWWVVGQKAPETWPMHIQILSWFWLVVTLSGPALIVIVVPLLAFGRDLLVFFLAPYLPFLGATKPPPG